MGMRGCQVSGNCRGGGDEGARGRRSIPRPVFKENRKGQTLTCGVFDWRCCGGDLGTCYSLQPSSAVGKPGGARSEVRQRDKARNVPRR